MYIARAQVPLEVRDSCSDLSQPIRIAAINKLIGWSMTRMHETGISKRASKGFTFFTTIKTDAFIKAEIRRFMTSVSVFLKTLNGGRMCFEWVDHNTRTASFQRPFGLQGHIPASALRSMQRYAAMANRRFQALDLPMTYEIGEVNDDKHLITLAIRRPEGAIGSLANEELFRRMYLVIRHVEEVVASLKSVSRLMMELPAETAAAIEAEEVAVTTAVPPAPAGDERFAVAA